LIGDDEHGWDDDGIFNFEGGCYAKTINLTEKREPEVYRAIKTDALLENVVLNKNEKNELIPDYVDISITENGRVSYPVYHIEGYHEPQMAGHPNHVIFLTCDAFGVLPPVAKLTSGQAMYHFISGYTAKVAGTERGIKEPVPFFSACFGAAFMTLHPSRYADLLKEKIEKHGSTVWLVNTGWQGGSYGVGERVDLVQTRKIITSILDGTALKSEYTAEPFFGLHIPTSLEGVDSSVLNSRNTWADKEDYDRVAKKLAASFIKNFKKYEGVGSTDYTQYGPQV
jgi:ATP-dependent phosphoenolpyruvate carboxykinase